MGQRGPGRQLDLRESHAAADLRGPICLRFREPVVADALSTSWPGLSRPSTPLIQNVKKDVDARDKRGHDEPSDLRARIGLLPRSLVLALTAALAFTASPALADPI